MARYARIDSRIRADRLILANRFRLPELNPFFANRAENGGLDPSWLIFALVARFAGIDSHDSCKSGHSRESEIRVIRANRPDAL